MFKRFQQCKLKSYISAYLTLYNFASPFRENLTPVWFVYLLLCILLYVNIYVCVYMYIYLHILYLFNYLNRDNLFNTMEIIECTYYNIISCCDTHTHKHIYVLYRSCYNIGSWKYNYGTKSSVSLLY